MATYTIIGGDQKPYSSVSAEDVCRWIADGRLNAQSLARGDNDTDWRALSEFPEFAAALAPGSATPPPLGAPMAGADAGRAAALKLVKGPAIALIITAGLGVAYYGLSGLFTLFIGGAIFHQQMPAEIPPQMRSFVEGMQGPMAGVVSLLVAALNGFVLFGAVRMLRLQNHSTAMIAAVTAMLPCQCCCLFGLPFGIWALMVLNKPEVKTQFT